MKLDKKGFAFSTMLYGSVALIAAVLYIILNTSKSSVDTTYYYGEEILKDLNDCVTEEIALENCYSSGSTTCDATAYHACLGVSDSNAQEKGVIISETLKDTVITSGQGLYKDPYVTDGNRYIYVGFSVNNYLTYSGKLWRIVSIEKDGSLLLLDSTKYSNTEWDITNKGAWDTSTLFTSLNVNYITTITDTSKMNTGSWNLSIIYPSLTSSKFDIYDLEKQEHQQSAIHAKVGLLSLSDYIKATQNSECKTDTFGQDDDEPGAVITQSCDSWLTEYKGWTLDINGEKGSNTEGYAFYIGDEVVTDPTTHESTTRHNKPVDKKTNEKLDVYPVINLNRNSVIKGGTGTLADPYVLK